MPMVRDAAHPRGPDFVAWAADFFNEHPPEYKLLAQPLFPPAPPATIAEVRCGCVDERLLVQVNPSWTSSSKLRESIRVSLLWVACITAQCCSTSGGTALQI